MISAKLASAQDASSLDDLGTTSLVAPTPSTTMSVSSFPTDTANNTPPVRNAVPFQVNTTGGNWAGHSYFFLDYDCCGNHNLPPGQEGFVNRGRYLERAIQDATELADTAGTNFLILVTDLYLLCFLR